MHCHPCGAHPLLLIKDTEGPLWEQQGRAWLALSSAQTLTATSMQRIWHPELEPKHPRLEPGSHAYSTHTIPLPLPNIIMVGHNPRTQVEQLGVVAQT